MTRIPPGAPGAPPHVGLAFVRDGDTLHVLGTPDGRLSGLRRLGVFTPDWRAVADAALRIRAHMRHATQQGELSVDGRDEVTGACAFLFDELIPPTAKTWLRAGTGALSLSLPGDLLRLPWELLRSGDWFLGERWAVGRLVQTETDPDGPRDLPPTRRSILLVADPDGQLPEAYDEGVALADALRAAGDWKVALRTTDVDAATLRTELRGHDVVHFAGHIDPDGWRTSASRFDRDALDKLAGGAPLPALVFANGCGAVDETDFAGSMLEGWLAGGVRNVVGPLFELPDTLGRRFAERFYAALLRGATVGEAVRGARVALSAQLGDGVTAWGAYALYGDPGTRYAAARTATPRSPRAPAPVRLSARRGEPVAVRATVADPAPPAPARRRFPMTTVAYLLVLGLAVALAAAAIGLGAFRGPGVSSWAAESDR